LSRDSGVSVPVTLTPRLAGRFLGSLSAIELPDV
jgi:hypothetical protein